MSEADAVRQVFEGSGLEGMMECYDRPDSDFYQVWFTLKGMMHKQRVVLSVCKVAANVQNPDAGPGDRVIAAEVCTRASGHMIQDFGYAPVGGGPELAAKLVAWAVEKFGKGVLYQPAFDVFQNCGLEGRAEANDNDFVSDAYFTLPRIVINEDGADDHLVMSVTQAKVEEQLSATVCYELTGKVVFDAGEAAATPENARNSAITLVQWVKDQGGHGLV